MSHRPDDDVAAGGPAAPAPPAVVYYLTWTTRRRAPLLQAALARTVADVLLQTCAQQDWTICALEIAPDAVHLTLQVPPRVSALAAAYLLQRVSALALLHHWRDQLAHATAIWSRAIWASTMDDPAARRRFVEQTPRRGGDRPSRARTRTGGAS